MGNKTTTILMQGDSKPLAFEIAGVAPTTVGQVIMARNAAYGNYSQYRVVRFELQGENRVPVLARVLTQ
jgi:hypothetical protein